LKRFRCGAGEDGQDQSKKTHENEIIHGVKAERNLLHTINRRKADWIGHVMHRNSLLKHVIEREGTRR
jgi:hypothetical protein